MIHKVRSDFSLHIDAVEESVRGKKMENILLAEDEEIKALIISYSKKSCGLDPITIFPLPKNSTSHSSLCL